MSKDTKTTVNDTETSGQARQKLTQSRSRTVHFRLLARDGLAFGPYPTAKMAVERAAEMWPHEEQDPDRTGTGWDIEVVRD